ncbi:hypothetical protein JTE90_017682 [Oedothorax gibbosus]|uniref:Uncharacterized protein n=1 Tax=Oedothorax gibbosus TaxID=931172 RepID=A0AAV6UZQ0_9ARAC|nr:hypothetical protein JTE90_017682 [Oedothorax gibbosus]
MFIFMKSWGTRLPQLKHNSVSQYDFYKHPMDHPSITIPKPPSAFHIHPNNHPSKSASTIFNLPPKHYSTWKKSHNKATHRLGLYDPASLARDSTWSKDAWLRGMEAVAKLMG